MTDYLLSVLPDGFITAEKLKEEVKAHLATCKRTDKANFREDSLLKQINCIWSVWWRDGFLRIFTQAFLLFLASTGGYNPAGQSFTLT